MLQHYAMNKNYDSISPSARSLLIMKAHTDIPFAEEAASMLPKEGTAGIEDNSNALGYWVRVLHFEARYKSINMLMQDVDAKSILEISSGFSFRGLNMVLHHPVHYIDTDLPGVIETKAAFIADMLPDPAAQKGILETLPMNAVDEKEFEEVTGRFAEGPVTVVNEGLMMYLDTEEKKKLCANIHRLLKEHGGYWITADVYVKGLDEQRRAVTSSAREEQFFAAHNIEENKFESYEQAEVFFKEQGFVLDKEAVIDYTQMSAVKHIMPLLPPDYESRPMPKIQATWRLKAI